MSLEGGHVKNSPEFVDYKTYKVCGLAGPSSALLPGRFAID